MMIVMILVPKDGKKKQGKKDVVIKSEKENWCDDGSKRRTIYLVSRLLFTDTRPLGCFGVDFNWLSVTHFFWSSPKRSIR